MASNLDLTIERLLVDLDAQAIHQHASMLVSDRETASVHAARLMDGLCKQKPEVLTGCVEFFVAAITSRHTRVVNTAAETLPILARIAPARVAKHLDQLTENFRIASPAGQDGLVRTFAALCTASVAYQKRLEDVLGYALSHADPKTLLKWSESVLPALKGEPHARTRTVVESRVLSLPKPFAQKLAAFLGVKIRASTLVRS